VANRFTAEARRRLAGQFGRELWIGDAPGGNYTDRIRSLANGLGVGAHVINVLHDDDCAIFRSNPCNCDPEVSIREDD
jgi:hypothetical protein